MQKAIKDYQITEVYAYNAHFDINALNNTLAFVTDNKCRFFFERKITPCCIWHIACQTVLLQKIRSVSCRERVQLSEGDVLLQ